MDTQLEAVAKNLDDCIITVLGSNTVKGFVRAYEVADAIEKLRSMLTADYMKPIMALQGNKLGFRTDKDLTKVNNQWVKGTGYPMDIVRECLIEAVLIGLQPTNNEFNIIGGNMYPTKEGCGVLLSKVPGLKYSINTGLPRLNADKTSCAFTVKIKWTIQNTDHTDEIEIPIKTDQWTSVDAMVGKATRKARAWLLSRTLGFEITDGDAEDTQHTVVSSKVKQDSADEKELSRMLMLINQCENEESLHILQVQNPDVDVSHFDKKREELRLKKS